VLKKTGDYIASMQQKIAKHQEEIQDLKSQNSQLEVSSRAFSYSSSWSVSDQLSSFFFLLFVVCYCTPFHLLPYTN
jgi:hypothetical protein